MNVGTGLVHVAGGYGLIRINRKNILSHRFSWGIHFGRIPEGLCVLHECDNRRCVNPNHLFLGTNQDNVDDKVNKNRQPDLKGENNGSAKLTSNQVREIRQLCRERKLLQKEIAKMFHISPGSISHIYTNKTWRHI